MKKKFYKGWTLLHFIPYEAIDKIAYKPTYDSKYHHIRKPFGSENLGYDCIFNSNYDYPFRLYVNDIYEAIDKVELINILK